MPQDHITLRFDVNQDDYEDFIRHIRDVLRDSESHGIPALRPQQPETAENARWLDILLVAGEHRITVRLEQSNLYVRGYQRTSSNDDHFWEFHDTQLMLPRRRDLGFTGGYVGAGSMGERAGLHRQALPLGGHQLENAIINLATKDPLGHNNQGAARNLFVIVQMIPEAARLPPIAEHIVAIYYPGGTIDARMVALENGWGRLSTAVLQAGPSATVETRLPNIPDDNPTHVYTLGDALAVLGLLLVARQRNGGAGSRHKRVSVDDYGRCLMNLEYVCINYIDGEDPGNLFGTVTVNDGWFTYTFYDRSSGDYEYMGPGGLATLTDPSQSHAVSGADSFVLSVDLFDYDLLSPNDKIAQGKVVWDLSVESVTFANYDKHLYRVVEGDYGSVTVGYSVLSNARSVTIQVLLINGDGEDQAEVYGMVEAYQNLGGTVGPNPITLFRKSIKEYVEVGQDQPIPLTRKVMAASTSTNLTIKADLWDHDKLSPDDEIVQGAVSFTVQPGTQKLFINGQYGQVQVIITCE